MLQRVRQKQYKSRRQNTPTHLFRL